MDSGAAGKREQDVVRLTDGGALEWTLIVEAKASQTLDVKYTVAYPVGEDVQGLARGSGNAD